MNSTLAGERCGLSLIPASIPTLWWLSAAMLLLVMSSAAEAVTVTGSPTTCTSVTGVGTLAWSNPGNALALDGVYTLATATSATGTQLTNYLKCSGYGFNIPSTATINGITVNIVRHISSTNNTSGQDNAVRVVDSTGAIGTTDRSTATAYTTADVTDPHGGAADLWGATWSPANINSANFGVAYSGNITKTSTSTTRAINIDVIQISVDYTVPFSCSPPSNVPAGVTVTCQCDTFARATLNPSTIFGSNWTVSTSDATGILPSIVNSGYLRLTNNTGNNAKAATVPGIFPAAGNYISVEFQQYAYNGSTPGADGIAVTLSDYSVPAVPGAYGGSLGYAQETGIHDGFAGGWLGVGLDEYGNYQSSTEGRLGGLCTTAACMPQSVGARGSGTGQTNYRWLGGTSTLSPTIDNHTSTTASYGYYYQVVVDARNDPTSTSIAVNRDTGSGYVSLISIPNVYTAAIGQGFIQAPVPANWQISFTGSTGGSNNIHEIGGLRICASTMVPPGGGTAGSFNAIDEAYGTPPLAVQNYLNGHIYTKLVGTSFKLNVAALSNSQILTTYAASAAKTVTVKLVDNSDSLADSTKDCTLSCTSTCTGKTAVTGGTQTLTFAAGATDKGQKQSPAFTISTSYQKLVAIISDGTTSACSTDSFAIRPLSIASVTSSNATNAGTSGNPIFKAGSDNFALTATTTGIAGSPSGYTGVLKINNAVLASSATYAGAVTGTFPAATSATSQSTATGTTFAYSEVGGFTLPGYALTDSTSRRGVYDGVATADECTSPGLTTAQCDVLRAATWTGVDSISTKNDCVLDSYSNVRDVTGTLASNPNYGKFGCNFGLVTTTAVIGRFTPDHFDTAVNYNTGSKVFMPCPSGLTCPVSGDSTYAWSYADAATRNAATGFVSADIGKVARQLDNSTFWILTATTPTWNQFVYSGFVYSGQPFTLQITARNAGGAVTKNYDSGMSLSKATTLSAWNAAGASGAANSNPGGGTLSGNSVPSTAFSLGIGTTTSTPIYTFPSTPVAPADIYVRATDTDSVTSLRTSSSVEGGVKVVSGRMSILGNTGSELLPLSISATVQYYNVPGCG